MDREDRESIILGGGLLVAAGGLIPVFVLARSGLAILIYLFAVIIILGAIYDKEVVQDNGILESSGNLYDSLETGSDCSN